MTEDNNTVILSVKEEYIYILHKSTKEELEEFESLLNQKIEFKDSIKDENLNNFLDKICVYGNINETKENPIWKQIIPIWKEHKHREKIINHEGHKTEIEIEYKCFSRPKDSKPNINSINLHEDPLSSFKCACATKNIQYYYVLKTKKEFYDNNLQNE